MPYATLTDLTKALPEETIIQLTDDELVKPAAIDPTDPDHAAMIARITEAIADADAEIDGYCATKYATPLAPVPAVIKGLSVEIATYRLHARKAIIPEDIAKRYDKAVARLKDIARGLMTLGVDPAPSASVQSGGAATNKTASDRVFTRDTMKGF